MKTWNTRVRIFAGFASILSITIAMGILAFVQLHTISQNGTRISEDALPCVYWIGQIQKAAMVRYNLLSEHVNSSDKVEKTDLEGQIDRTKGEIDDLLAKYEKTIDDPKDQELFATIKSSRAAYVEGYGRVLALSREGKREAALGLMKSTLRPLRTSFFKATDAEIIWNKADADDAAKQMMASVRRASTGIMICLALALAAGSAISIVVSRAIAGPLAQAVAHLSEIAKGDLSHDAPPEFQARGDEIGMLARAKQSMIVNLRAIVEDISKGVHILSESSANLSSSSAQMSTGSVAASERAHSVAAAAEEMSTNITSVAAGMEQTSTNLAHVASATEQMTSTIGEIAGNAEKARRITDEATRQAARISDQINQLGLAAQQIGKVTETITEISSQTNLLALNATIEAARAGAAGKGFAVVATEIKALAQQTAAATEDIKKQIADVQSATVVGITEVSKVSQVILDVSAIVGSIAAAIEEQATVTKDIARNIAEASLGVNDANARVSETSVASREIAGDIQAVDHVAGEMATGSDHVRTSAGELAAVAERLKLTAERFHL